MSQTATTPTRPIFAPPREGEGASLFTALCWVQGLYFLTTGVWPLVSIDTFQMVTGPKTDLWLVRTVGVLVAAIAVVLLMAAWRRQTAAEVGVLAVASAGGLAAIDVIYVTAGVIAPIYLADAALEAVLIAGWAVALAGRPGERPA